MVIQERVDIGRIGHHFAELVRGDAAARDVFVIQNRDTVEVWHLTDAVSFAHERRYYNAASELMPQMDDVSVILRLADRRVFRSRTNLIRDVIPSEAQHFPVHPTE